MLSKIKTLWTIPRRLGAASPALTLGFATTFVALAAVAVSFTPAYAALNCQPNQSSWCFGNIPNPCGAGCLPDNNGDMCTDQPGITITFFTYLGPRLWSVCTGGTLATQSCGETPTSCGKPTYYYKPFATGSGGTNNCTLTCMSPLVWKACAATNGATPCPGVTGNPIPGQ